MDTENRLMVARGMGVGDGKEKSGDGKGLPQVALEDGKSLLNVGEQLGFSHWGPA